MALALVRLALAVAVAVAVALALVRELLSKNLKILKISKVLRMDLPIVESLSGPSGNIFSLSRIPQLHFYLKNNKKKLVELYSYSLIPPISPVSEMRSPETLRVVLSTSHAAAA